MRQGFSLTEAVLVLAVSGVLFALALPSLFGAMDRIAVEEAANQVVAAHQRARFMAITRNEVVTLTVQADSMAIRGRVQTSSLWSAGGPASSGVQLGGPSRQFTFSPEGLTLGLSNASLRLTRGSASRIVLLSRLGRVRIQR